jgi:hypothetical protein
VLRAQLLKNPFFHPARAFSYTSMNLQTMTLGTLATSLTAHPATRATARRNLVQLLTRTSNSSFHETGRLTAMLETVFGLSCDHYCTEQDCRRCDWSGGTFDQGAPGTWKCNLIYGSHESTAYSEPIFVKTLTNYQ